MLVEKYDLKKSRPSAIATWWQRACRARALTTLALTGLAPEMRDHVCGPTFRGQTLQLPIASIRDRWWPASSGAKSLSYDLWCDAVNAASRMESHGQGNVIQIMRAAYCGAAAAALRPPGCWGRGGRELEARMEMRIQRRGRGLAGSGRARRRLAGDDRPSFTQQQKLVASDAEARGFAPGAR